MEGVAQDRTLIAYNKLTNYHVRLIEVIVKLEMMI